MGQEKPLLKDVLEVFTKTPMKLMEPAILWPATKMDFALSWEELSMKSVLLSYNQYSVSFLMFSKFESESLFFLSNSSKPPVQSQPSGIKNSQTASAERLQCGCLLHRWS